MAPSSRADPPYQRIITHIRRQIASGELRAGDRLPPIRLIAKEWGVAVATATKAMAILRDAGVIEPKVGSGTVVSAQTRRLAALPTRSHRGGDTAKPNLDRARLLRAALTIVDAEGLDALTMRRVATELAVAPMSLYRHIASKDELVIALVDNTLGKIRLPDPGPDGWRAKLELISRSHWRLFRRHLWLPEAISFTRPLLAPNAMLHTEWTLRALNGLGLSATVRIHEALTLPALIVAASRSMADEIAAGEESGMNFDRFWSSQSARTNELFASGHFPCLASIPAEAVPDLDTRFEYVLARHLDGLAVLIARAENEHSPATSVR